MRKRSKLTCLTKLLIYFYEAIAPKLKQLESRAAKAKAVQSCASKAVLLSVKVELLNLTSELRRNW
jgi:hypothetical protein